MAHIDFATLANLREVQSQHGPNMCLASSKFLALKILGFIDPHRHLRDFLRSEWAKSHPALPLVNSWGWTMSLYNDDFNKDILPAALNEPAAGVRNKEFGEVQARYEYFRHQTAFADHLLQIGAPVVVGVGYQGSGQDHHIVVVRGANGSIWAVDPWPGPAGEAIKTLPRNYSFARVQVVELSLGELHVPCASQVFGYYRDADHESRQIFTVQ